MSVSRRHNGHTDDGTPVGTNRCPNCESTRFVETVSMEHCPDCGLRCDYWGGGANDVYKAMLDRQAEDYQRGVNDIMTDDE